MKDSKRDFIIYLSSSLHISRIFNRDNKTLRFHVERLSKTLEELFKEYSTIELDLGEKYLFLNKERMPIDVGLMGIYRILVNDLRALSIGTIRFTVQPTVNEIISFVYIIGRASVSYPYSFGKLLAQLEEEGVESIEVEISDTRSDRDERGDSVRKTAVRNFMDSIYYLKDMTDSSKPSFLTDINVHIGRRMVRRFYDLVEKDEGYLLALTTIKNIGSYTLNHSVNVCILSLAMGITLGLSKKDLLELGIAALFHDLGKIDIPEDILQKPEHLTDQEFEKLKKHPYLSAERILLLKRMDEIPIFAVRGILEHHIDFGGGGYPNLDVKSPSLFARIIRIVDSYDAMTTSRSYQAPVSPFDAIKYIVSSSDKYDPSLVKVFLDMMGIYPPGTVVLLKGGMVGVMLEKSMVAVVSEGGDMDKIKGEFEIEKALSPDEVDFDPAGVIIALSSDEDTSGI
ncbi:HD domain-containing protein [candidate division WOR-3 bacterium]|nr:HD domain-containing protein [candidate division WOR-3 bacterium]